MPTFYDDILPLFTDTDVACMRARGVLLASYDWWTDATNNFSHWTISYNMVKSGRMPLGGPRWDDASVQMLQDWKDAGFPRGTEPVV